VRNARGIAAADGIGDNREHDRNCSRCAGKGAGRGRGHAEDRIGSQIDHIFRQRPDLTRIAGAPANFDPEIAAFSPAQLRKPVPERREPRLCKRIALRITDQPPISRTGPACCARAMNGQAAALPKTVMNRRRRMVFPKPEDRHRSGSNPPSGSGSG